MLYLHLSVFPTNFLSEPAVLLWVAFKLVHMKPFHWEEEKKNKCVTNMWPSLPGIHFNASQNKTVQKITKNKSLVKIQMKHLKDTEDIDFLSLVPFICF